MRSTRLEALNLRALFAAVSGLAARRTAVMAVAVSWLLAVAVMAIAAPLDVPVLLILLVIGLNVVGFMQSHRLHRMVALELRRQAADGARAYDLRVDTAEILDRLKLLTLSFGRLSEDLAYRFESTWKVARMADDESFQPEAMEGFYGMMPSEGGGPPMRGRAASPEVLLLLTETLRTHRPRLIVECGSGPLTLWCALAIRLFDLDSRIVALQDDQVVARQTRNLLATRGVAHLADVRVTALETAEVDSREASTYLQSTLNDLENIELLVLSHSSPPNRDSWLVMAPILDRLADNAAIMLTDPALLPENIEGWLATEGFEQDRNAVGGVVKVLRRQPVTSIKSGLPHQSDVRGAFHTDGP